MDYYLGLKTVHILSSTILFGTGIGIAYFFFTGVRSGNPAWAYFSARTTVVADMIFTLNAGLLQPVSGFLLVWIVGYDPLSGWLVASYLLYGVALLCWLPVVWLQLKMRDMLLVKRDGGDFDEVRFKRFFRAWFLLGWPAFAALIGIFTLMVVKPGW